MTREEENYGEAENMRREEVNDKIEAEINEREEVNVNVQNARQEENDRQESDNKLHDEKITPKQVQEYTKGILLLPRSNAAIANDQK